MKYQITNDKNLDAIKDNFLPPTSKKKLKPKVKKGESGIHIKPENKGKFTETKKKTGKSTEELTHSKNPLTRKRAIFAQNAKKWKHQNGGVINYDISNILAQWKK